MSLQLTASLLTFYYPCCKSVDFLVSVETRSIHHSGPSNFPLPVQTFNTSSTKTAWPNCELSLTWVNTHNKKTIKNQSVKFPLYVWIVTVAKSFIFVLYKYMCKHTLLPYKRMTTFNYLSTKPILTDTKMYLLIWYICSFYSYTCDGQSINFLCSYSQLQRRERNFPSWGQWTRTTDHQCCTAPPSSHCLPLHLPLSSVSRL